MRFGFSTFVIGAVALVGCASASPGGDLDDLATGLAPGPAPSDLSSVHDFAPHDLAQPPADLAGDFGGNPGGTPCTTCTITLVGGIVAAKTPSGGDWDSGSLADAYVNLTLTGGATKRSSTYSDVTTVTWNEVMFAGLSQAQVMAGFTVTLMDEDPLNPDDLIANWAVTPTLAQLATGSITLTSGSGPSMTSTLTLTLH